MSFQLKSNLSAEAKRLEKEYQNNISDILGKMAKAYSAKALEYVPPGMTNKRQRISGKKINPKLYKRKFEYLPQSVKDRKNKLSKTDAEFLHKKYYYRLISTNKLKANHAVSYQTKTGTVYGYYFKTVRALKKWIKIKNRGLFKVLFGANLVSIRQTIPGVIKSLLNKSKNLWLSKMVRLNELNFHDNNQSLKITNKFKDSLADQSFYNIAVRQGEKQAQKALKKEMKIIMEKKESI